MKKTLLSLVAVIGVSLTAPAETVEIVFADQGFTNAQNITEIVDGPITLAFDKGTGSTAPAYYNSGTNLRLYVNNTMTISAESGFVVTGFTASVSSGNGFNADCSVNVGTLDIESNSWSGSASSVQFTQGNKTQVRMTKLEVSYEATAAKEVEDVKISSELDLYAQKVNVSLTCATAGASIYYTVGGGSPILYTAPFSLSNSAEVSAYAEKGTSKGEVATKQINVPEFYSSFSSMIQAADKSYAAATGNFSVLYQSGAYLLLTDGKSNLLVYGSSDKYEVGTNISGLCGTVSIYGKMFELTGVDLREGGEGAIYKPVTLSTLDVLDINDNLFDEIIIKNCEVSGINGKRAVLTLDGESVDLYNTFGIELVEGTGFEVTAFVWRYNDTLQLAPVSIVGGKVMLEPEISFSVKEIEATLGTDFVAPVLTVNPSDLAVSYTSSNESVATVDDKGNVTLLSNGVTTITATTKETDTYLSGSDSYTLTVKKNIVLPAGYQEELTAVSFGFEEGATKTTYFDVEYVSPTTGIKYNANMCVNEGNIQLRTPSKDTQADSGIIVAENTNKYPLKAVYVEWNSKTVAERQVNIYGSATAYSTVSDLYDEATAGELLSAFAVEAGDDFVELVQGSTLYFGGVRSNKSALYLKKVVFVWDMDTSVSEISNQNEEKQIYDLNGRLVKGNLEKGIYVVRQGNKTSKMLVK